MKYRDLRKVKIAAWRTYRKIIKAYEIKPVGFILNFVKGTVEKDCRSCNLLHGKVLFCAGEYKKPKNYNYPVILSKKGLT